MQEKPRIRSKKESWEQLPEGLWAWGKMLCRLGRLGERVPRDPDYSAPVLVCRCLR